MSTTAPKPFAFVLMPFDDAFNDIYQLGIKEACKEVNIFCERVDEQIFDKGTILDRIYNQITKADIIIADLSGRNPNVFPPYPLSCRAACGLRFAGKVKTVSSGLPQAGACSFSCGRKAGA